MTISYIHQRASPNIVYTSKRYRTHHTGETAPAQMVPLECLPVFNQPACLAALRGALCR